MNKFILILVATLFISCASKDENSHPIGTENSVIDTATIVDSLLASRHKAKQTNILSKRFPSLSRDQAIEIQLAMLQQELDAGARQIGWKMGGTATDDSASYDPMFGYMLDSNLIAKDSLISINNFPAGQVMVEGEIGFVMGRDFKEGAQSLEELKSGIDHIINAVEFAQDIATPVRGKPDTKTINHTLAAGMGHAGVILGSGQANLDDIQLNSETARCFINGDKKAEGVASNIYGGPLNALYSLVNMLPKYGRYLKKGDIIITGSVYDNPSVDSTSRVRVEFSSLGSINFRLQ